MTILEVVLVSVLSLIAVAAVVGVLVSNMRKDDAIAGNNATFAHMASQFALQLRLGEGEDLPFAEMAMRSPEPEKKRTSKKWRRRGQAVLNDMATDDGYIATSEADVNG